jgi:hypothetical protein
MRWSVAMFPVLLGCHIGRPPPTHAYSPGPVQNISPQPELSELLRADLTAALARRSALGDGPLIEISVLSADTVVQATNAPAQLHRAQLVLQIQTSSAAPQSVILRGARSYPVDSSAPLAAAAARTAAMAALSEELMEDAVEWLLYQEAP